jgi:hypothetical protein
MDFQTMKTQVNEHTIFTYFHKSKKRWETIIKRGAVISTVRFFNYGEWAAAKQHEMAVWEVKNGYWKDM